MIITSVPGAFPTIYANAVNVTTTKTELILDFAYIVQPAEKTGQGEINTADQPSEFTPQARVILGVANVRRLGQLILKAAQQQEQASSSNQPRVAEEA